MNRALQLFLLVFNLGIVLLYNIGSSFNNYQDLYGKPVFGGALSLFLSCLDQFDHSPALEAYARLSGMKCGYGFFSPNVGSPCFLQVTLQDAQGNKQVLLQHPLIRSFQGRIRYHNFLNRFRALLPAHNREASKENGRQRVIRALARSAGLRAASQQHIRLACIRIYIYRHQLLRCPQSAKAGFVPLYEQRIPLAASAP